MANTNIKTRDNGGYANRHLHPNHYRGSNLDSELIEFEENTISYGDSNGSLKSSLKLQFHELTNRFFITDGTVEGPDDEFHIGVTKDSTAYMFFENLSNLGNSAFYMYAGTSKMQWNVFGDSVTGNILTDTNAPLKAGLFYMAHTGGGDMLFKCDKGIKIANANTMVASFGEESSGGSNVRFYKYSESSNKDATTLNKIPQNAIPQLSEDGTLLKKGLGTYATTGLAMSDNTLLVNEFFRVPNGDGSFAIHQKGVLG